VWRKRFYGRNKLAAVGVAAANVYDPVQLFIQVVWFPTTWLLHLPGFSSPLSAMVIWWCDGERSGKLTSWGNINLSCFSYQLTLSEKNLLRSWTREKTLCYIYCDSSRVSEENKTSPVCPLFSCSNSLKMFKKGRRKEVPDLIGYFTLPISNRFSSGEYIFHRFHSSLNKSLVEGGVIIFYRAKFKDATPTDKLFLHPSPKY